MSRHRLSSIAVHMANITEKPLAPNVASSLDGSNQQAARVLRVQVTDDPKTIITAIDTFADNWQQGVRPAAGVLDGEDAPFALGSLWAEQLIRKLRWEWANIIFHDHGNSKAPAILSPDRALAIYPIHFLIGALKNPGVDVTIALAFNMLVAGKFGKVAPKSYLNVMESVRRIVPRR